MAHRAAASQASNTSAASRSRQSSPREFLVSVKVPSTKLALGQEPSPRKAKSDRVQRSNRRRRARVCVQLSDDRGIKGLMILHTLSKLGSVSQASILGRGYSESWRDWQHSVDRLSAEYPAPVGDHLRPARAAEQCACHYGKRLLGACGAALPPDTIRGPYRIHSDEGLHSTLGAFKPALTKCRDRDVAMPTEFTNHLTTSVWDSPLALATQTDDLRHSTATLPSGLLTPIPACGRAVVTHHRHNLAGPAAANENQTGQAIKA